MKNYRTYLHIAAKEIWQQNMIYTLKYGAVQVLNALQVAELPSCGAVQFSCDDLGSIRCVGVPLILPIDNQCGFNTIHQHEIEFTLP